MQPLNSYKVTFIVDENQVVDFFNHRTDLIEFKERAGRLLGLSTRDFELMYKNTPVKVDRNRLVDLTKFEFNPVFIVVASSKSLCLI